MFEIPRNKIRQDMLRIVGSTIDSTQNIQSKSGKTNLTKIVSIGRKDKTIASETMKLVPPLDTLMNLPTIDYNIV